MHDKPYICTYIHTFIADWHTNIIINFFSGLYFCVVAFAETFEFKTVKKWFPNFSAYCAMSPIPSLLRTVAGDGDVAADNVGGGPVINI